VPLLPQIGEIDRRNFGLRVSRVISRFSTPIFQRIDMCDDPGQYEEIGAARCFEKETRSFGHVAAKM